MNADQLVVFDTTKRQVIANLDGFTRVHGVTIAAPIRRVYASITGTHQVAAVDAGTLKIMARTGPIDYPDGVAYAPKQNKIFVSDEHGGVDAVIDANSNKLIAKVALGGGAGNTVYDAVSGHILVAVHGANMLAVIDPETNRIVKRVPLAGIANPHGIALDASNRIAFVAGEENHSLAMIDLATMKVLSTYQVGDDPDVIAYDPGLRRLYVSAESWQGDCFCSTMISKPDPAGILRHAACFTRLPVRSEDTPGCISPLEECRQGKPYLMRIMRPDGCYPDRGPAMSKALQAAIYDYERDE